MIYSFEMGLENKYWNDNLRQVSKQPSQPHLFTLSHATH